MAEYWQPNLNERDEQGQTLLYRAVVERQRDLVQNLLEADADPQIPDDEGLTPLQLALREQFTEIVELLETVEKVKQTVEIVATSAVDEPVAGELSAIAAEVVEPAADESPDHLEESEATGAKHTGDVPDAQAEPIEPVVVELAVVEPESMCEMESGEGTAEEVPNGYTEALENGLAVDDAAYAGNNDSSPTFAVLNEREELSVVESSPVEPLAAEGTETSAEMDEPLEKRPNALPEEDSDEPFVDGVDESSVNCSDGPSDVGSERDESECDCQTEMDTTAESEGDSLEQSRFFWKMPMQNAWSPLHLAAASGDVASVRSSLAHGADPNATDGACWTPLHLAAQKESAEVVQLLLEAGANPLAQTKDQRTPLDLAKRQPNSPVVPLLEQWMMSRGLLPAETADKATESKLTKSKELVKAAELAKLSPPRNTESVDAKPQGKTSVSVESDLSEEMVESEMSLTEEEQASGLTLLHAAVQRGSLPLLRYVLRLSSDLNGREPRFGETALHFAASCGDAAMVEALLAAGASVDLKNRDGVTPLLLAAQENQLEVVRILLAAGADLNVRANEGITPLHQAAAQGFTSICELLLKSGSRIDPLMEGGWTPLHFAVQEGFEETVNCLLAAGAQSQHETTDGATPLHLAAAYGYATILKQLLATGADPDLKTRRYGTPLHQAAFHDQPATVAILLEAGAARTLRTEDGKTPYEVAHSEQVRKMLHKP
ncbi:MAG: ankyrin repeat domain-containing protein [Thermoguttaceae bacterium]|nr:ankyrin repeat domain-containing protein [Thermoguttaceae bacterium]